MGSTMDPGEWLALAGWALVIWVLYSSTRKHKPESRAAGRAGEIAPSWLRKFSIMPTRVVNLVRVDSESYRLENASAEVRDTASKCWADGRCRSLEFARFMDGDALAKDMRLYFARLYDGEGDPNWYAFVAPAAWWRGGAGSQYLLKN